MPKIHRSSTAACLQALKVHKRDTIVSRQIFGMVFGACAILGDQHHPSKKPLAYRKVRMIANLEPGAALKLTSPAP